MKISKYLAVALATISFIACKKDINAPSGDGDDKYIVGYTRVVAMGDGKEVASTKQSHARIYVAGEVDEDDKLRVELIDYQYLGNKIGLYKLRVINKTTCQSIIRWNWQGLTIDSITPPSDVVHAKDTVTFTLWGDARPGKITLNSQADNPTSCGNSKTLVINITQSILPIEFISFSTKRNGDTMITNFTVADPQEADEYIVLWSPDAKKEHEIAVKRVPSDGKTKQYTVKFLAFIYEG